MSSASEGEASAIEGDTPVSSSQIHPPVTTEETTAEVAAPSPSNVNSNEVSPQRTVHWDDNPIIHPPRSDTPGSFASTNVLAHTEETLMTETGSMRELKIANARKSEKELERIQALQHQNVGGWQFPAASPHGPLGPPAVDPPNINASSTLTVTDTEVADHDESDDDDDFLTSLLKEKFGEGSTCSNDPVEAQIVSLLPRIDIKMKEINHENYHFVFQFDQSEFELQRKWPGNAPARIRGPVHDLQKLNLKVAIAKLHAARDAIHKDPYNPGHAWNLAIAYASLSYPDMAVSYAYLCLNMLKAFSDAPGADKSLRRQIADRFSKDDPEKTARTFRNFRNQCSKLLIFGLLDCQAVESAVEELASNPADYTQDPVFDDILHALMNDLGIPFTDVHPNAIISAQQLRESGHGSVFKRAYPWLDKELTIRTPWLLREWIRQYPSCKASIVPIELLPDKLDRDAGTLDLEELTRKPFQLHFGTKVDCTPTYRDCGSLGIMAMKNISAGEVILVDRSVTCVSTINPGLMTHCDACLANIYGGYSESRSVCMPICGCKIAFCSEKCLETAINGYHKILCGHDFDWLYKLAQKDISDAAWEPLVFLRIVAVILADNKRYIDDTITPSWQQNPLFHPLLARLTAGYVEDNSAAVMWDFNINVKLPHRILRQLGINVYKDPNWAPEIIHTILMRIRNNAHRGITSDATGERKPCETVGICPNFIFFNHSCEPNVDWMTSPFEDQVITLEKKLDLKVSSTSYRLVSEEVKAGSSTLICRAKRDIMAGEELFIAYIMDKTPSRERSKLLASYGIDCECDKCTHHLSLLAPDTYPVDRYQAKDDESNRQREESPIDLDL